MLCWHCLQPYIAANMEKMKRLNDYIPMLLVIALKSLKIAPIVPRILRNLYFSHFSCGWGNEKQLVTEILLKVYFYYCTFGFK